MSKVTFYDFIGWTVFCELASDKGFLKTLDRKPRKI